MGVETQVDFIANLHPSIKGEFLSRPRDPQRWAFVLDAPRPDTGYSVHNNSLNNLLRGLNERVFYTDNSRTSPLTPGVNSFDKLFHFENAFKTCELRVWTPEQFVDSYTGSQKLRYQRACQSLAIEPLSKRDSKLSTFVKCEKIDFKAKQDPAPRVIQPRNPRFNVSIGVYVKPLEKLVYRKLSKLYKFPCVAKGFDVFQTGDIMAKKWSLFESPCAIGLDASRFDQHCSVQSLEWTHKIYKKFCGDPLFSSLLSKLLVNEGVGVSKDGKVKYTVEGRRMSGDMDTALGNCLLMVAMTYSYCQSLGVPHEVMDNGDDIVVIIDKKHEAIVREGVQNWYSDLGFKMKVEDTVYELEHLEFCQMHPVFDGSRWRMVRNMSCLAKDLVCTSGQTQVRPWLRALGEGGLSLTSGLPVLQEFYLWLQRFDGNRSKEGIFKSKAYLNSGFLRMSNRANSNFTCVTDEARASFHKAFGYDFPQQEQLEMMYQNLGMGPLDINHIASNCLSKTHHNNEYLFQ